MSTALRLGAFVVLLLAMVGSGFLVGDAVGPLDVGGAGPARHGAGHTEP